MTSPRRRRCKSWWLAGPEQGGFTREVLSHFVFLAQRLFGPAVVAEVQLTRAPGQAETALRARLMHAAATVQIEAASVVRCIETLLLS